MSIRARKLSAKKNPACIYNDRLGIVYDVVRKYEVNGKWKTYTKRGFHSSEEAMLHDIEMSIHLANPDYVRYMN